MSDIDKNTIEIGMIFIMLFFLAFVALFALNAGCVTASKNLYHGIVDTPIPTTAPIVIPTETTASPTPEPTPTPDPKLAYEKWRIENGGYHLNTWHQWYRENVQGKQDMIIRATVYDYKILPSYRFRDFSWGSQAKRRQSPAEGYKYLFIFIRMENIGTVGRTWGFGRDNWYLQINNTIIGPEDDFNPEWLIVELENSWTRDHVETPPPYQYKRIQEAGTGIVTAEQLEWLEIGQPWDGYIIYQVPDDVNLTECKVLGRFDNAGGSAWWDFQR